MAGLVPGLVPAIHVVQPARVSYTVGARSAKHLGRVQAEPRGWPGQDSMGAAAGFDILWLQTSWNGAIR